MPARAPGAATSAVAPPPPPAVIAVVGPTATGKTPLAVALGGRLGGCEMVVADSRQTIRGLRVGTCAPTAAELGGMPCHLLDLRAPGEPFTAADWLARATPVLDALARAGRTALLVGGTGLYVAAALDGLALGPPPDPEVRRRRDAAARTAPGRVALVAELRDRDPAGAAAIDLANPRRVVRALELVDATGSVAAGRRRGPGRPALRLGLDAPRELHDRLIEERACRLLGAGGLLTEVEAALAAGVDAGVLDRAGIGYREALDVLAGRATVDQAVASLAHRTRRYAKAQRTWFRRDPRIRWVLRGAAPVTDLVDEVIDALHQDGGAGERLHRRQRP